MNRLLGIVIGCAILAAGFAARAEEIAPTPVDGKIRWVYRYDEGKQLARRLSKPMFVVFRCER